MDKQYWVGEFYVDLSRNQITQHGQPQTLPPKALRVLTYLAQNRGRVVSYEELLNEVWANAVVTPNTLQRSIAQLRKVLGENSKAQNIIKTHAKQGYSLEGDVRFTEDLSDYPDADVSAETQQHKESPAGSMEPAGSSVPTEISGNRPNPFVWATLVFIVVIVVGVWLSMQPTQKPFEFGELRYLTATDDKEYGATYSPDGEFIVFRRYYGKMCVNDYWAKNAQTLEEIKLTKERGHYSSHSLSDDGKQLLFIKEESCDQPVVQNMCFTLLSLDFEAAQKEPQIPNEILHCQNSEIARPNWLNGHEVVMMQRDNSNWRLVKFSLADNSSTSLYDIKDGTVVYYTFSRKRQLLAVVSIREDGRQYIDTLLPDGQVQSSAPINFPDDMPRIVKLAPTLIPGSDNFMFGYNGQLYSLSPQGEVAKLSAPLDRDVGIPDFHPGGEKVLLITGQYDSDIASLTIPAASTLADKEPSEDVQSNHELPLSVISRSVESEDLARFQPNGKAIAFASEQTGSRQIWLLEDGNTTMISRFPTADNFSSIHWSDNGDRLLAHTQAGLHLINLHGEDSYYESPYTLLSVFHWDSTAQKVIANILQGAERKFVEIDLTTNTNQVLAHQRVFWAAKNQDGTLVYMDGQERFWKKGPVENELINTLASQGWKEKRFVFKDGKVYGINRDNHLWSYDIATDDLMLLAKVPDSVVYLTDIKNNQLLAKVLIAEKKEIIELEISH